MDPTNCPPGLFSDTSFQTFNGTYPCDTPLSLFVSLAVIVSALRFGGFLGQAYSFATAKHSRKRALPVGAILGFLSFFFYTLLFVLLGLDIVGYENGSALALNSIAFLPFAIGFTLYILRVVRLGGKISPLLRATTPETYNLTKFTGLGKSFFVTQIVHLCASTVVLVVFAPSFPEYEHLCGQIGFVSKGIFLLSGGVGLVYQIQRCITVIQVVRGEAHLVSKSDLSHSDAKVDAAVSRMRSTQFMVCAVALPVFIFALCLAGDALPWTFVYVSAIPFLGESINTAVSVSMTLCLDRPRTPAGSRPSDKSPTGPSDTAQGRAGVNPSRTEQNAFSAEIRAHPGSTVGI